MDFVFEYLPAEALEAESAQIAAATSPHSHTPLPSYDQSTLPLSSPDSSLSLSPEELTWLPHHASTAVHELQSHDPVRAEVSFLSCDSQVTPRVADGNTLSPRWGSLDGENEVLLFRHFVADLSVWV